MNGITVGKPSVPPHELLEQMKVPLPPPDLEKIYDATAAEKNKIRRDTRFTDAAKTALLSEVQAKAWPQHEAACERELASRLKPLDTEEGQLRREFLNPPPSHDMIATERERLETIGRQIHRHATLTAEGNALHMVAIAPDADELLRLFDDAENRGIESVMAAATFRSEALAREARRKENSPLAVDGAVTRIARELRERLKAFRKAHPSPSERLRVIAVRRQEIVKEFARARGHWLRVYGWTEPKPTRERPPAA